MESCVQAEEAKRLFGNDFLGPEAFSIFLGEDDLFGPTLVAEHLHESSRIPFSTAELMRAKFLGMILMFRISHDKYGNALTIRYLREVCMQREVFGQGKEQPWYATEGFAHNEVPHSGWSLVRKKAIPGSLDRTWQDQSEILKRWTAENHILPEIIRRRTAVEAVYDVLLYYGQNRESEVDLLYDWTATLSSEGWPVFISCYDSHLWIDALPEDAREPCIGVYPALECPKSPGGLAANGQ